jgi:hypothetical protein
VIGAIPVALLAGAATSMMADGRAEARARLATLTRNAMRYPQYTSLDSLFLSTGTGGV